MMPRKIKNWEEKGEGYNLNQIKNKEIIKDKKRKLKG